MHLYDDIGVTRVINASGSMTYLGGSLIAPEVLEKMKEAAGAFVVKLTNTVCTAIDVHCQSASEIGSSLGLSMGLMISRLSTVIYQSQDTSTL